MNKKLLALAVAGAFAAPVAMADTSNVVVYGVVNMSIDSVDGGSTGNTAERRTRVSSNNSNLGFKGTEDLGNGLSAVWQFESAIAFDQQPRNDSSAGDASGGTGARNTYAGLSSKTMGALTLGNQESPMKTSIAKLDMFGNTIADYRTLIGPQVRGVNSVLYSSPSFNGFDVKAMYSARNEAGNGGTNNPSYWSASATYANGPILAAVAYEVDKAVTAASTATSTLILGGVTTVLTTPTAAADTKQTTTRAGFGYNFGTAKVGLGYNTTKQRNNLTSVELKVNSWLLSGAYAIGKTTLKAQYVNSSDTKGNATSSEGAKQWTIGADYSLSKRTTLYALYTQLRNDSSSSRTLGGNSTVLGAATGIATVSAGAAGEDPKAFSVGMVHSF
jgi:predicted porin